VGQSVTLSNGVGRELACITTYGITSQGDWYTFAMVAVVSSSMLPLMCCFHHSRILVLVNTKSLGGIQVNLGDNR
jgi:hypothetical protein